MPADCEISIENLRVSFRTDKGKLQAIRGINLKLQKGETLAIVGESGSGKSVTAKALLGIEAPNAIIEEGSILYKDIDLLKCSEKDFTKIRGNKITMIFQDPLSSLDPIVKIGPQMTEASLLNGKRKQREAATEEKKFLSKQKKEMESSTFQKLKKEIKLAEKKAKEADFNFDFSYLDEKKKQELKDIICRKFHKVTKEDAYNQAIKIMEEVGIRDAEKRFNQYPFEFSGGMRQRIVIAIAIAANPDILICDEPTTALDVTIQAQILDLIKELKEKRGMSVIFITHDLGVVANIADRVAVMYAGKIVEEGTVDDIFYNPAHPYTWALLSSVPDMKGHKKLESIPGSPPDMHNPPKGDAFAPRNKYAMQIDFEEEPPIFKISESHYAATWLLHPNAPKIQMPQRGN